MLSPQIFIVYLLSAIHVGIAVQRVPHVATASISINGSDFLAPQVFFLMVGLDRPVAVNSVANIPDVRFDCQYSNGDLVKLTDLGKACIDRGAGFVITQQVQFDEPSFIPVIFHYDLGDYFIFDCSKKIKVNSYRESPQGDISFPPVEFLAHRANSHRDDTK